MKSVPWNRESDERPVRRRKENDMATEWATKKAELFANMLDKLSAETGEARELLAGAYIELSGKKHHSSDCATSNAPAMLPGRCDCDA